MIFLKSDFAFDLENNGKYVYSAERLFFWNLLRIFLFRFFVVKSGGVKNDF